MPAVTAIASTPAPTTIPAAIETEAVKAAAAADAAIVAAAADAEKKLDETRKHKAGDKVLVAGTIASQCNPLTNQIITHGMPVIAEYDRWIEIQIEAKVLTEHKL